MLLITLMLLSVCIHAEPSSSVVSLQIDKKGSASLTVSWSNPHPDFLGGPVKKYNLVIQRTHRAQKASPDTPATWINTQPFFSFTKLTPASRYIIFVAVCNQLHCSTYNNITGETDVIGKHMTMCVRACVFVCLYLAYTYVYVLSAGPLLARFDELLCDQWC